MYSLLCIQRDDQRQVPNENHALMIDYAIEAKYKPDYSFYACGIYTISYGHIVCAFCR